MHLHDLLRNGKPQAAAFVAVLGAAELERDAVQLRGQLLEQRLELIADRGVLKAGMWADLVIFDPTTIRDLATRGELAPSEIRDVVEHVAAVLGVDERGEGRITA